MMLKSASRRPLRAAVVHLIRVVLTAALLFSIPAPRGPLSGDSGAAPAIDLTDFAQLGAVAIGPQADANGMWPLLDREGGTVGRVARTLPAAVRASRGC